MGGAKCSRAVTIKLSHGKASRILDVLLHGVQQRLIELVPCSKLCLCIFSSPNPKLSKSEVGGLHQSRHGEVPSTLKNRVNALGNVGRHMTKPPTTIHVLSPKLLLHLTGLHPHPPVLSHQQAMPVIEINFALHIGGIHKELLGRIGLELQSNVRSCMSCIESMVG
ncbi:hypothetical protein PIB30_020719 [Stylosanthes scabra]|uniref:Uncharacterized protein n=1 Tax=Stylosanthes scabra TaxID=79078 RepID=A0ABU6Y5T9_9FABA|nr:hypothetical protein [Stylosanthes scabra]